MKKIRLLCTGIFLSCFILSLSAQTEDLRNSIYYQVDAFGSAASGDNTPFWLTSNKYGIVPLEAGNGYLRPAAFLNQSFGKGFYWSAGMDIIASAPRYRNVYIQQLYAELGYKSILLSIGSKERYNSLWDKRLSSGDMVSSANARPIPEINLSMPAYTVAPFTGGWLQVKWNFAVGRSFDKDYLKKFSNEDQIYIDNTLWHHKSAFIRIKDTRKTFPISLEIGIQHWAQWGGTSTDPEIGKQPQSFKDLMRIIAGKEGGEDASSSAIANVLGNHYGSYDFRAGFSLQTLAIHAYYQHYFEDKSGMRFENKLDGLWGLQVDLPNFFWLQKFTIEYLDTRNQSGTMHFIDFDHSEHPGRGAGADNYYNNGEYTTGTSYFNRGLGNPLLLSPEYNTDGSLGFKNNRIRAWNLGFEGAILSNLHYRLLLSNLCSWGTQNRPLLNRKNSTTGMLEITYTHPRLSGWEFTGSVAADKGSYLGKSVGFGLCISKRGVLTEFLP